MLTKQLLLVTLVVVFGATMITNTYAKLTDEEMNEELDNMCDANPNDSFCKERNGDDDDDRECENPPDAASCNNENNDKVDEKGHYTRNTTPYQGNYDTLPTGDGCYDAGYDDGKNGPFDSHVYHDNCEQDGGYYDGFIDGCMDVGNTEEECERATDA